MRALSIRQPYAEEIMRGLKVIEYRNGPTKIIGERFYIYAAKGVPTDAQLKGFSKLCPNRDWLKEFAFPTGVIVGTAVITQISPPVGGMPYWHWHLGGVKRLKRPRKPKKHPQPSWFNPY